MRGSKAAARLSRHAEFLHVQRHGFRYQTAHFVIYACRFAEGQEVRLGMTVSRRIGKAVVRNTIKRRIRECFRLRLSALMPAGTALVVIARGGAQQLSSQEMLRELMSAVASLSPRLRA